jgi:hypothetical protein
MSAPAGLALLGLVVALLIVVYALAALIENEPGDDDAAP